MQKLELYFSPSCSYCLKVLNFMKQNSITIPLKNKNDEPNRQELVKIGGKPQVPCLIIDGEALYESNDIIEWLKLNRAIK